MNKNYLATLGDIAMLLCSGHKQTNVHSSKNDWRPNTEWWADEATERKILTYRVSQVVYGNFLLSRLTFNKKQRTKNV